MASTTDPVDRPTTTSSASTICEMLQMPQQDGESRCIPVPGSSDPCKQIRIVYSEGTGPFSLADTKRAVDLQALLSREVDQSTNFKLKLGRTQRFGIAAALTWAVLYMCDSPWLEEVLRNKNIHLFLEEGKELSLPHISKHPYLSYDFQRSAMQPDLALQTAAPADQFQTSQIQNPILYSLAMRLIELGVGKTFEKLRREYRGANSVNAAAAAISPIEDYKIAKEQIEELMLDSESYAYAVDRCLRFLFPGPPARNTFEYVVFRKTFFDDVVAPIQAVFDYMPTSESELSL